MENYLFDLKVKELKALKKKYRLLNDILILDDREIIGCKACYMKKPVSTVDGFKIDVGFLINYYERFKEKCTVPKELAINIWLCPKCNRVFKELIPKI